MLIYTVHCKHCGQPYSYQASGYGCFDKYNNRDYCPECQKAILDALALIPIKVVSKWRETTNITYDELLPLKEEYQKKREKRRVESIDLFRGMGMDISDDYQCLGVTQIVGSVKYYKGEEYYKDGYHYRIEWDENKPETKVIFVKTEYYIQKNEWGNRWHVAEKDRYMNITIQKPWKLEDVPVCPMSPPEGKIMFMGDWTWDVITNKK